MGTNESKLAEKLPEDEKGSIPSTPILTPKLSKAYDKSELDPRSPSKTISRTPIHLMTQVSQKLEALSLTENIQTPIRTKILDIDPRSPALDFPRTPIVVSASPEKKVPDVIRNKNLDKVRGLTFPTPKSSPLTKSPKLLESTTVTPKKSALESAKRKSFVLLETNIDFTETDLDVVLIEKYSVTKEAVCQSDDEICKVEDPRSPAIDFVRTPIQISKNTATISSSTDILTIDKESNNEEKSNSQDNIGKLNEEKSEPEEMLHKTVFGVKFEDSVSFVCVSPMSKKLLENDYIVPKLDIPKDDENSESESENKTVEKTESEEIVELESNHQKQELKSDNSPVKQDSVEIAQELTSNKELGNDKTKSVTAEQVLDICDEILQNSSEQTNSKLALSPIPKVNPEICLKSTLLALNTKVVTPKKSQSETVIPAVIDLTADVRELDKKLTNLIYEDEDLVVCPRIVKIKEQSRTPLGLRNSNDNKSNQRPAQKLKVSDKPRKSEYAISKIPVFKEKKVKKGLVQCENTPPRGMTRRSEVRPKKSLWDAKDDTLLI